MSSSWQARLRRVGGAIALNVALLASGAPGGHAAEPAPLARVMTPALQSAAFPGAEERLPETTADLINTIRRRLDRCDDEGMLGTLQPVALAPIPSRPDLTWNPRLATIAERHAQAMATQRFFDHVDPQGRSVGQRATAGGYRFRVVGENLAAGHTSVADAMRGWLLSLSHCTNLIDARFTEFGIARVPSADPDDPYAVYWALVLGRPKD